MSGCRCGEETECLFSSWAQFLIFKSPSGAKTHTGANGWPSSSVMYQKFLISIMSSVTTCSIFEYIDRNHNTIASTDRQWQKYSKCTSSPRTNPSKLQECDCLENRISASCYWDFVLLFGISKWRWDADRQHREGGTKLAYSSINTIPLFYFLPRAVFSMPVQRAQSVKNHHCGKMHTGRQ